MFASPTHAAWIFSMLAILCTDAAFASGASGGYSNRGLSNGNYSGEPNRPRDVDRLYEYGKSLYLGREPGITKVKYCVLVDGEPKKLKGRHLKTFKGSDRLTFANALHDCANTEKKALLTLDKEQVPYVLYYLNKRYKLELGPAAETPTS